MIVKEKSKMYTSKRTMIHGHGYVDVLKGIGSYISQNKDLLAKPMLGAAGDLAAFATLEGGKAIIKKLMTKNNNKNISEESKEILERLQKPIISQSMGSGIKRF
jgi:hypothetical protein